MLDAHPAPGASARPQLPPVSVPASGGTPVDMDGPAALLDAAWTLLPVLEAGRPLDAGTLRDAMTRAFGASDADGAWVWKDAYEAAEAAVVLFVQRYGRAMRQRAGAGADGPRKMLAMLAAIAALEPSHTKRSEDQVRLQQFSTPLTLAYAALRAAAIRPGDTVLEPSAGTGMLAVMAECALASRAAGHLHLNEIASIRAGLLAGLFPGTAVTRHNAEALADFLPAVRPTVVLMNPPFSATPGIDRIRHDADLRHIRSAFSMLPPGGRLAAITSAHCVPGDSAWREGFTDHAARTVFTMAIDGRAYARRGTGFNTRLTVIERSAEPGIDVDGQARAATPAELLDAVIAKVPPRLPIKPEPVRPAPATVAGRDLFGRPATRETMARPELDASNWRRADEATWRTLWEHEIAELPSHRESRFWLAAGLLLPIWDRLPFENMRVRRPATDDGEALIGRVLDGEQVRAARASFGLDGGPAMTGEEAFEAVMARGTALPLANGWRLARRRIMGADRVEIEGPADTDVAVLKRIGCTVEDRVVPRPRLRSRRPGARPRPRTLAARRLSRLRDTYRRPVRRRPVHHRPRRRHAGGTCRRPAGRGACHVPKETEAMTAYTLPDEPNYCFAPAYDLEDEVQQIRIVFENMAGYVPTALVALDLDDAERLCNKLNARLGLTKEEWTALAAKSMRAEVPNPATPPRTEPPHMLRSRPGDRRPPCAGKPTPHRRPFNLREPPVGASTGTGLAGIW